MEKGWPALPVLPALLAGEFYLTEEESTFQGLYIAKEDRSYGFSKNLFLKDCHLEHVMMQRSRLERFECRNVRFEKCDFANLEWLGASFHRVVFSQCKLTGANFSDSFLQDCLFEDCHLELSAFSNVRFKSTAFTNCRLVDSDFLELDWQRLFVRNCDLTGSNWFHTKLNGLDFTSNTFERISLSQEQISGLKVNQEQALVIAAGLGLIID